MYLFTDGETESSEGRRLLRVTRRQGVGLGCQADGAAPVHAAVQRVTFLQGGAALGEAAGPGG